jgi:hypothetical protein
MEAQDNDADFARTETASPSLPMKGLSFHTSLNRLSYMAALPITAQVPLVADPYGTLRVQGTRVTLDSIVTAFRVATTAEEIAQKFPSVSLGLSQPSSIGSLGLARTSDPLHPVTTYTATCLRS